MKTKVKVKKSVSIKLSMDELGDVLRFLVQLSKEQEKLPNGVDPQLKTITSKVDRAYSFAFKTNNTGEY